MSDTLRQLALETLHSVESYHAARRAEMQAEIERLRTNILALGSYAKGQAEKYAAAGEDGKYMASYFRGKSEAYEDMAARADIAYAKEAVVNDGK